MQSYSLFELNEYIRRVIALNFNEPVWINCEIAQIKESRGNVYLELVEQDEQNNEIRARIDANIWYKSFLFIKNKLGALTPSVLSVGVKVLLKVNVEFHERYGLKLNIEDIDPSYTIGQLEMARQKIMQRLTDEGVVSLNKSKALPLVFKNIAVISAANAAGYIDFADQLTNNPYGYHIRHVLFPAALQGQNTEREVCTALDSILTGEIQFDCIVIIRGGGSKLDLGGFDNFNIGYKIATSALPVITGIGHEIDSTVADNVSRLSLKTPTAVANFLIDHNLAFESSISELSQWIANLTVQHLKRHELQLSQTTQIIRMIPLEKIRQHEHNLRSISNQIKQTVIHILKWQTDKLLFSENRISMLRPENVLRRGYAIVRSTENVFITNSRTAAQHASLNLTFYDDTIEVKTR
jgi:exodeoxyribonuclease VII large subunit